jgi:hypothetical protein
MSWSDKNTDTKGGIIVAVFSLVVSLCSLGISYRTYLQNMPVSPAEILGIIEAEARASKNHDPDAALLLFDSAAVIRDAGAKPPQAWAGIKEIRERYAALPVFAKLDHIDLTVSLDSAKEFARVKGSTSGEYIDANGKRIAISSVNGEEWALRKGKDGWRIISFSYNLL